MTQSNPYSALHDDYDKTWELLTVADSRNQELEDSLEKLERSDLEFRQYLWLGHGHNDILYGDDGEMQCGICKLDFKRDKPKKLMVTVLGLLTKERGD